MKTLFLLCLAALILQAGCRQPHRAGSTAAPPSRPAPVQGTANSAVAAAAEACGLVLAPPHGDSPLDLQIVRAQETVLNGQNVEVALERLGWLFVAKARASFDESFYAQAERCAACLDSRRPADPAAMLLRGHVLHNLHRFKEAEPIARWLAEHRAAPSDFGLLGDVLMEIGRLTDAAAAYQQMMDLRPDSRAQARAAHMRWLKGDLAGAIEAMESAARAVSRREGEAAAWMLTRLSFYYLASGDVTQARQACLAAKQLQPDYAPAWLMEGRAALAEGESAEAVTLLQQSVRVHPLPEAQWLLAEALFECGRFDQARAVEAELGKGGAARDARTYALYLATRGEQPDLALMLAQRELEQRADVFTHDALGWCLAANGRLEEARVHMEKALAEGSCDPRLFFHAAVIAARSGRNDEAARWRQRAETSGPLLFPSERWQLQRAFSSSQRSAPGEGGALAGRIQETVSAAGD